ncbi:MAG TPA: VOC family protein [Chitinophagaceae bacterium]
MKDIIPCLCFKDRAEEAMNNYISLFKDSHCGPVIRLDEAILHELSRLPPELRFGSPGSMLYASFELCGQKFFAVNGGPHFKFTPAISFFVHCASKKEVDHLFEKLSDNGNVLMPLDNYGFSERFGWLQDKYGVSWQLNLAGDKLPKQLIVPFLMFVGDKYGKAEEAINFYVSSIPGSDIVSITRYPANGAEPEGTVQHAMFTLLSKNFMAIDSSHPHAFTFTDGISFYINCDTQEEIDQLWEGLATGGEQQECGWVKDRYGVSWQIAPAIIEELRKDPDCTKNSHLTLAILKMKKLEVNKIEEAFNS